MMNNAIILIQKQVQIDDVFIVSAARIPIGKQNGYLRNWMAPEMLEAVLDEVIRLTEEENNDAGGNEEKSQKTADGWNALQSGRCRGRAGKIGDRK